MLFNSLEFLGFFSLFFFIYWLVFKKNLMAQNLFLLLGSYAFYAWWDWRFLSLIIGSSILNYILGIQIQKSNNNKIKRWLVGLSIFQGIGLLVLYKYADFFIVSFVDLSKALGLNSNLHTLNLILPLGISFYTFRTLSYILDIYKNKIKATTNWVAFFSYVAFFPSLISGPIDRASTLIPQIEKKRHFDPMQMSDAMRQILWGLFKKMVIADNCAALTNQIFDNYLTYPASSLVLGAFFFTIQVYADFSGYSDMAIGVARLLGFNVSKNFNYPFFSQTIAEFWQKWHISLTSWMTDYVFAPLNIAFRDYGNLGLILAILLNFLAVGIWHGANWTFLFYGFIQACLFVPMILRGTLFKKKKFQKDRIWPTFGEFRNMLSTFVLIMFTNVIFRVEKVSQAFEYFKRIISSTLFSIPEITNNRTNAIIALIFIAILLIVEWLQRNREHGLEISKIKPVFLRFSIYYALIFCIIYFGASGNNQFIYFKF